MLEATTPSLAAAFLILAAAAACGGASGSGGSTGPTAPAVLAVVKISLPSGVLRLGDEGKRFQVKGGFLQAVDDVVRVVTEKAKAM